MGYRRNKEAGQEVYESLIQSYFRDVAGAIIAYDITNKASFDKLSFWFSKFEQYGNPLSSKILVGNKSDMKDKLNKEEGS